MKTIVKKNLSPNNDLLKLTHTLYSWKKKDFWIYILFDSVLEYHTVNKISVKVNLSIVVRFIKIVAHLQSFCDY